MSAETIARALGGEYRAGSWWRARCPVHGSNGASLALTEGQNGVVAYCHGGCSRLAVMTELRRLRLIDAETRPSADELSRQRDVLAKRQEAEAAERKRKIAEGLDIWADSYPADATGQIGRYLGSRGILIPIPPTLRLHGMFGSYGWHPAGGRWPQMVALIEHVEHGPVGVSRTFLIRDGSAKVGIDPVRLFKGAAKGGAVRLGPVKPGEWLAVGEGVETVLSVMQSCELAGWAALSATGLESLMLPAEADRVLIAGDNDANARGQRAALIAARRFRREGRRVKVIIPPVPDTDWNDVLLGRAPGVVRHG